MPWKILLVTLQILWIPLAFAKDGPPGAGAGCGEQLVRVHSGKLVLSTEAVDLVIAAMSRAGWDLKPAALKKRDADVRALTQEKLGHEIGAEEFIKKAQFRYKNWTNAVAAVGGFESGRTEWDRVDALGVLRDLAADGPVYLRAVKVLREEQTVDLLRARGIQAGAAAFVDAMLSRHANSWEEVLKAAGLSPLLAAHSTEVDWSPGELADAVRYIASIYPRLQSQDLLDQSQEVRAHLFEKFGRSMTGTSLREQVIKTFETWYAAMEYAGLDWSGVAASSQTGFGKPIVNVRQVMASLREVDVSLHSADFLTQHALVYETTGYRAIDIWLELKHRYGSWPLAVTELAPDYELTDEDWLHASVGKRELSVGAKSRLAQARESLDARTLPEALGRALFMVGQRYPRLRFEDFRDHSADIEQLISRVLPHTNGQRLFRLLEDQFGLLSAGLEYAGFDGRSLPNRSFDLQDWDADIVVQLLHHLSEAGVSLSARDFLPNHRRIAELCALRVGYKVSAFSLWVAAHRFFRSWPEAVQAACPECEGGRDLPQSHPALWPERMRIAGRTLANQRRVLTRKLIRPSRKVLRPDVQAYVLRLLAERNPEMRPEEIRREGQAIALWLYQELGQAVHGQDIVAMALEKFESWEAALEYSGFDTTGLQRLDRWLTRERVLELGKAIYLDGVSLRPEDFLLHGATLRSKLGGRSAYQFWRAAVHHFGSWPTFVRTVQPYGPLIAPEESHSSVWSERLPIETAQSRQTRETWVAVLDHSSLRARFGPTLVRLKDYVLHKGAMNDRKRVEHMVPEDPTVLALVLERLDAEFQSASRAAE